MDYKQSVSEKLNHWIDNICKYLEKHKDDIVNFCFDKHVGGIKITAEHWATEVPTIKIEYEAYPLVLDKSEVNDDD